MATFELSQQQRDQLLSVVETGCDRETAARTIRVPLDALRSALEHDEALSADLQRSEGIAELYHLSLIRKASADPKNWRASVWWLESRAPERYGRRKPSTVTQRQMAAFVDCTIKTLIGEVHDERDRDRLAALLRTWADPDPRAATRPAAPLDRAGLPFGSPADAADDDLADNNELNTDDPAEGEPLENAPPNSAPAKRHPHDQST